jgi:hypothetical protein
MRKNRIANSSTMIGKKRKNLQEYFDTAQYAIATPNQRSQPKYKNAFNQPKKSKSNKK